MNQAAVTPQRADMVLFLIVVALLGFGTLAVYSASSSMAFVQADSTEYYLFRHLMKVVAGIALIFFLSKIDYHIILQYSKPLILTAVIILLITLIAGGEKKGATRWLELGPISFQPSELAKWALILHLATLLPRKAEVINDFGKGILPILTWAGPLILLIAIQPNFSTAMVLVMITVSMMILANLKIKYLLTLAAVVIPAGILYVIMSPYRLNRIQMFLSGHEDSNYQLAQALIALGNGGLFGVGIGESKQRDFFLPEPFNDFILPIIGEEYGFIGVIVLLAAFWYLLVRGIRITKRAPDPQGFYLAAGIVITITLYAIINTGVTCGLFPTTGLPMPFISYGGTSILFSCAAVGILLNISKQAVIEKPPEEDDE